MENNSFGCQPAEEVAAQPAEEEVAARAIEEICLIKCNRISDFKQHVSSHAHQKKMEEVFQTDMLKGLENVCSTAFMPSITIFRQPVLGLSLLTLCFSPGTKVFFYLCHVCEEKVSSDRITSHLCSRDHCSNYFNFTDPDVLSFAWMPSMDMRVILKARITKEEKEKGIGQLQMLDLPANLLKKFEPCTYSEVMGTLSENAKLMKLHKARKPNRTMIEAYQRDSKRTHPLLGMKHIVECICANRIQRRYYLCTVCNLTLATHMIIQHVLSFDHIFCYFKAWHPSTLLSKECYRDYTESFVSMILDFAKQTEEIHGTANSDMKKVILQPAIYKSVNFTSYTNALKELISITKDESLVTNIKPGNKLVMKEQESIKKGDNKRSLNTSMEPGNKPECRTVSAKLCNHQTSYKLRCQNCSVVFHTIYQYVNHLSKRKHKELYKSFGKAKSADGSDQAGYTPILGLYKYIKECLMLKSPAVGVPLVVTCVTTQVQAQPFYVCFACEDCFHESSLRQHFSTRKHLIRTLLYQNPWRLPFAWDNHLDIEGLRSMAWEEEKERGPNEMVVKVLDIPCSLFSQIVPNYPEVMKTLELHHTLLKREVPRCETYSKLKQEERFPLLGQQFLVMHNSICGSTETRFLCLLCQRRLSDEECHAHVFSREHVTVFLNRFHPGSLNSRADAEAVVDLAKQAANIHSISHVQVIPLERPIWEPCTYTRALWILGGAKKRLGLGKLEPPIFLKKKLVVRETLKKESQENIRITEESEKKTSQKSTYNNETTLKKIAVEGGAEITKTHHVESVDNAGKGANKETPTPSENDSEREVVSKTSSEVKNAGSEIVKEEKIEEPTMGKPAEETIENCQNTDKADETEMEEVRNKSSKEVLTQCTHMYKESERKWPSSMSKKSQEDACPNEEAKENMCHKMQQLTSKQQKSCLEVTTTDEGESCKPSHETAEDKIPLWQYMKRKSREPVIGLSALLECCCDERDPIYLCECCSLKIPEEDLISHVTGVDHQQMYLVGSRKLSPSPVGMDLGQNIRHLSALFEQDNGYGDAQVVDLDEEIYENISKQTFKSAIETVKALQAQNINLCELPSTSALSPVQPVDTSLTIQAHHEASSLTDDCQNRFHPGSLNSRADAEAVVDLAKQAANIHSISHVQVIPLERPISEPCTYTRASSILGGAKKRLGLGKLEPPIFPKKKLVLTETLKKESQENIRITEESEKKTSQKSTYNNETTLKKIAVEGGAEIPKTHHVESGDNAGKGANKETPTPSENDSEREVVSKTSSEVKNAGSETIKEEKIEEATMGKPAEETIENCQNTDKADETEMEEVRNKSSKEVLTQCRHMYKESERKWPSSMSKKSQEDTCPNEEAEENMCHKMQQLTSKQQKSCLEVTTTDEGESCKPSDETAEDKSPLWRYMKRKSREPVIGLSALLECCCDERDPIYLCECCSLKIPEEDLISHVTGVDHQQMYLVGSQKLSPSPVGMDLGKNIRHLSALFEQDNGYGDAQVVDLDEEIYENISKQTFKSAIETVKALQAQNINLCELPSTSALSPVQLVDTSLTIQAQHEASSLTDDCQNRFHPGSLNSRADAEAVVDLAKQAANIHSISHVQVIPLERPISEPCTYTRASSILGGAKKRLGLGKLEPPIFPKKKLVLTETLKKESQENIRITEESEKKTSQKSTYNNETTSKKIAVEGGAEITKTHHVESRDNAGKGANKETPTPSENDSEREVVSKTSSEVKNAGSEIVKEEKIEEPTMGKPAEETIENCQNTDKADETEMEEVRNKSSKEVLTQCRHMYKESERKWPSSMSKKSQEDACPNEEAKENMCHKMQQLTSKQQKSCLEVTTTDEGESCKSSHETAEDKSPLWQYMKRKSREPVIGLSALLECCCDERDPIYLCECCSLKIPEEDLISHVTGVDHQQMYLMGSRKLSPSPVGMDLGKNIRHLSALFEQDNGYGDAQVVDLDEEIYENISKQTFKSAIETVKALQAQNINLCELPSTSALSPVQPVDTLLTIQAQHDASSLTDDCQVEKMEMDNNSEEVQLSSVNEDVKMTQIKVSESAANANSFLAVSSRHTYTHKHRHKHKHKHTSRPQVSTSGINISCMIPDPTGEENKTEVISNTTVGQTIPSCLTTSKLREPAYNCVQTTSRATATPDPSYSTTFKPEKAPKHSETSKTGATVKMIKTSVQSENAEASVKTVPMKNSAGSNADIAPNIPTHAAPHLSALMSVRPAESSHTSTSQTSEGPPKVGLNQLISVSCKGRRQVYCQLCSVRLKQSNHVLGLGHRYRYVQMKFPGWTAKPPALSELDKIVAYLAEKDVGSQPQRIAVDNDMYKRLSNLPEVEALEKVKEMLRHRDSHVSSFTTTDIADVSRVVSVSPCEASTPDDETKSISKEEGSLNISEPEAKDIHSDVKRAATKVKTPQSCADPVAIEEAPEMRQQEERRHDPRIQDTQKTSPVKFLNPDPTSSAASVNTELQSQSRTSQKAEHLPTPRTGHRSASQGLPRISIWKSSQGCSNLSSYLKVKGLSKEPIIGLGFVWECQGISQNTFFLCESCREMLFISDICQHVVSDKHQLKYMQSHRHQFLWFLLEEDLLLQMKQELLKDIAFMLSEQERDIDAQVVLLRQDLYEYVRTAPFSEALKLVQKIQEEPGVSVPIITRQQKDQQPEDRQWRGESFPTKKSIQALETDPRSDNEERQKTEEHHFKSTAVVGIKQRSVLSPLDLNSVSSKADSVVSLFRAASACPQDMCRTLLMPTELRPPVSQDLRPIPELEVKDMHSDFPSSFSVSPITSETMSVSPRNKCLPTRKRTAVTTLETLVGTCPNNPQLEHPLPAKCRCVSLQPRTESAPEFTPVNPAATSTLLSPEDKDAEPVSDKQDTSTFDWTKFAHLLALLREKKSEMRMSTYAGCQHNAGTSNSCTDRSSESGMEKSEEPKYGQTTLQDKTAKKRNRWEKWQKIKATWEHPPSTSSFEGIVSTACPTILGYENQLITPNTNSIKLPTRDELLAEKAKAVSTMLPSASNDDTSDPQHQRNVSDQSVLSTVSQVQLIPFPCVASNHNPGQIPQPQSNTETDSTRGDHLPIKAIITARPDSSKQRFVGSNVQAYTDVNRGNQVTENFSTVTTASPSDTTAASGSYGQYRQMAYITNGQVSGYLSSQAVTGYSTPDNLPVCLGNLYHCEGYPAGVFYPSQIYQGQEANRFGYSLATVMSPGLVRLGMQQQYSSWTSATLAPADGNGTNEAAYSRTVPFITEANTSQMFIAVNNNSTNRISPQVYMNPPVIHYLPPANSEISPQTPPSTHTEGVFTVAPGPP